jgi:hypothetical protein
MTAVGVPGQGKSTFINKIALASTCFDTASHWGTYPLPTGSGGAVCTKRCAQLDYSREPYVWCEFSSVPDDKVCVCFDSCGVMTVLSLSPRRLVTNWRALIFGP